MKRKTSWPAKALAGLVASLLFGNASAAVIRIDFEAQIRNFGAGQTPTQEMIAAGIVVGADVSGFFIIDLVAAGGAIGKTVVREARVSVGNAVAASPAPGVNAAFFVDNPTGLGRDVALFTVPVNYDIVGNGNSLLGLQFVDPTGAMISGPIEDLLVPPLDELAPFAPGFDSTGFFGTVASPGILINYEAEFISLSISQVPLPGALMLFGSAIVLTVTRRFRRPATGGVS
ncbi:MAG: hypothetical protein AAFN78_11940 [Pseudomonadota bacterium]